jgi:RHS repeat-associated protein
MNYDDNGNLILSHNEGRFYEYDDENQLTEVQRTAGLRTYKTTFKYDGKLRLRLKREYQWEANIEESSIIEQNNSGPLADPPGEGYWVLLSETRYIYDGMLVIQERDGNNTPTVTYTRGNDLSGSREGAGGIGGLLARTANSQLPSTNAHAFYHADGNGNITYLVDASQSLAASYRYDPFGNTISSSGSLATANVYRFSSKEVHTGTGLYYYGYRWYAPEVQRWPNRDPLGEPGFELLRKIGNDIDGDSDGPNLYTFVGNNPNGIIDTDGLSGTIAIPILVQPKLPNPINLAFCAGAAAGTALCLAFPDTMTKPGEWIGNLICPMSNSGERGIQGKDPNPWKGWRPNPKRPGWGTKKDPQTGKDVPKPRPPGPPPPNHPDW